MGAGWSTKRLDMFHQSGPQDLVNIQEMEHGLYLDGDKWGEMLLHAQLVKAISNA